jgi:AAA domain, putative AbiEii toxin, Type IV TA system
MYLTNCFIENVGPIHSLDLVLPFHDDGLPKPLVLVGPNGSGKSILLAYVVDALIEFAKKAYTDIIPGQRRFESPYFKLMGISNQTSGQPYGIGLLRFSHKTTHYSYVEKTGILDSAAMTDKIQGRFQPISSWPKEDSHKDAQPENQKELQEIFSQHAICYFPSSRHERPHWMNREGIEDRPVFLMDERIQGRLNKPVVVESSSQENRQWLLDVILDSMVDFEAMHQNSFVVSPGGANQVNTGPSLHITSHIPDKLLLKQSRQNVDVILSQILQDASARLALSYRSVPFRLSITRANSPLIPTLDHLSAGQAVLFNIFATIIRYADRTDLNKSFRLHEIEGIVLIDEVDAHLHTDLQHELLPKLLKLFPRVQFILSSHSPLFLLGMEKEFGSKGVRIAEMPKGEFITTERFSEFQKSFDYYKQTKAFEDELQAALTDTTKPLIFTEGELDPQYIKTALELLGENEMLASVEIRAVGQQGKQGPINSGISGLNHTRNVIEAHPDLLKQKVMLLYDFDSSKPPEDLGRLFVRAIPENNANTKVHKGIENLLPIELFEERFYNKKIQFGDYGEEKIIGEFRKTDFCEWVCQKKRNPSDFQGFQVVVTMFREFLDKPAKPEAFVVQ